MSKMPRVVISACGSGSGKTTIVCGLLKALKNRNIDVISFKCGPDYIDPMFHSRVIGVKAKNLDGFFCGDDELRYLFSEDAKNCQVSIIEGVMGYYDGLSMISDKASSYAVAKSINAPVILVINAKGMALSMVAIIKGMIDFRNDSNIKGVILNGVSKAIYESIKDEIEKNLCIKVVGYIPRVEDCAIESRHLGLITPKEISDLNKKIDRLGEIAEDCLNIDEILKIANDVQDLEINKIEIQQKYKGVKIAVANDNAFCFYYKDNIEIIKKLGGEIIYFSPLNDKKLPDDIDGLLLGGGYPELYAEELEKNYFMKNDIKQKIENGLVCHAECGGFMYLHKKIENQEHKKFNMVGIIDAEAIKMDRLVRFGYITLTAKENNFIFNKGQKIKAHEFHYWDSTNNGDMFKAEKPSGKKNWDCIHIYKNLICGYPHIYYYSNIDFVDKFMQKCFESRKEKC